MLHHTALLLVISDLAVSAAQAQTCGDPWSQGPAGPSARRFHAVAYDSGRGTVLLFGGLSDSTCLGDTWEWTAAGPGGGGSWQLRATTGPAPRDHSGLVYDAVRQKTVLFGGILQGGAYSNQTWEWDGNAWTLVQPAASPPAMDASLMAYDVGLQRTVLVATNPAAGLSHTWQYDGSTWVSFTGGTPIVPSNYASLAYDSARARMVLTNLFWVGYLNSSQQVWERSGAASWIGREYGTLPVSSAGTAAVYDPVRASLMFVDNQTLSGKTATWTWNGTSWTAVDTSGPPVAEGRAPVFDAAGGQLLLFGGRPVGGADLAETWLCRSDLFSGPALTSLGKRAMYLRLAGPTGTLSVAATGTGTLSYQWRLNQVELFEGGDFTGVNTPTLTINPTDIVYAGDYDVVVTDDCGSSVRPATHVTLTCYANCTNGTVMPVLTAEDFQCFLNAYAVGCLDPLNCYANCDRSTAAPFLNVNDFQCFLNQFSSGCP